jgi:hypothetical protein
VELPGCTVLSGQNRHRVRTKVARRDVVRVGWVVL